MEMTDIENSIEDLRGQESTLKSARDGFLRMKQELDRIEKDGSELYETYSKIKSDICPTCGQEVHSDTIEVYKKDLWKKIEDLLQRKNTLVEEMASTKNMTSDLNRVINEIRNLSEKRDQILRTIQERNNLDRIITEAKIGIDRVEKDYHVDLNLPTAKFLFQYHIKPQSVFLNLPFYISEGYQLKQISLLKQVYEYLHK